MVIVVLEVHLNPNDKVVVVETIGDSGIRDLINQIMETETVIQTRAVKEVNDPVRYLLKHLIK